MKAERPISELLVIVKDNLERLFSRTPINGGICSVIYDLHKEDEITHDEWHLIENYLKEHKPKCAIKRESLPRSNTKNNFQQNRFWWTPRDVAPRLRWLNKQIKSLK